LLSYRLRVWTSAVDNKFRAWLNSYSTLPTWRTQGEIAGVVGTSDNCVRFATPQHTARASYVAVDSNF
jgi:hypothetical protein